jgi:hypothetical protein
VTIFTENNVTESLYLKFLIERELRCHSDPRPSGAEIEGQVELPPATDIDPSGAGAGHEPAKNNFADEPTPGTYHPLIAVPSTRDCPVKLVRETAYSYFRDKLGARFSTVNHCNRPPCFYDQA